MYIQDVPIWVECTNFQTFVHIRKSSARVSAPTSLWNWVEYAFSKVGRYYKMKGQLLWRI